MVTLNPGLHQGVHSYLPFFQRNKQSNKRLFGLLQYLEIPDSRLHTVIMDFVFDMPRSSSGHDGIMVIVDKLTKFVCLAPVRKFSTRDDIARAFTSHIFQHHGFPRIIISDRDVRFTSNFWKSMCRRLHIQPRFSTAFHPQQMDRLRELIESLRKC